MVRLTLSALIPALAVAGTGLGAGAAAAQDADDLAQQLANPVASLISVTFQVNLDTGPGPDGWSLRAGATFPFPRN